MMHICGVTLWNVWIYLMSLQITATTGNLIETMNSQHRSNLLGLTSAFIEWISTKTHSQDNYAWRRVLQTNVHNLSWTRHWRKMPFLGHNSCSVNQENILLHIYCRRPQDPGWGSSCQLCPWLSLDTGYVWGPGICTVSERRHSRAPWWYMSNKGSPKPAFRILFQAAISSDVSSQTIFPYYTVR